MTNTGIALRATEHKETARLPGYEVGVHIYIYDFDGNVTIIIPLLISLTSSPAKWRKERVCNLNALYSKEYMPPFQPRVFNNG